VLVVEIVYRHAHLLQVVFALSVTSRFASLLHGWQQKSNKNSDDRDNNQELDQSEGATLASAIDRSETSEPLHSFPCLVEYSRDGLTPSAKQHPPEIILLTSSTCFQPV
jgi:hypothetical protein